MISVRKYFLERLISNQIDDMKIYMKPQTFTLYKNIIKKPKLHTYKAVFHLSKYARMFGH